MSNAQIRPVIRAALFPDDQSTVENLFRKYADGLGIDLSFQQFGEELAALPGKYAPPAGRLLLAYVGPSPAGCIALRPCNEGSCEIKRLYVPSEFRGKGIGRRLVQQVLDEAREAGYWRVFLDTLPSMHEAIALYESFGFRDTEPYCHNPVPGARFLALALEKALPPRVSAPMDLLDRLLRHDAWTTCELLRICRGLTDEQLDREFDIAHRTVRATFVHIIRNVEVWSDLMAGQSPRECLGKSVAELTARAERAFADLASLARNVAQRGAWNNRFWDVLDEPPVEKTLGGGIAHVVTHSMHHRAQLLYMLRRLGLDNLPEGDVLTWEQQAAIAPPSSPREAPSEPVNLQDKFGRFSDYWNPKVVGELNGQQVKLVKFQGEFAWHKHDNEDELFLVVKGRLRIEFRDRHVWLNEGEFLIVPQGVEHRPVAEEEVHVMLFEPASTLNTGNMQSERTVAHLERI